MPNKRSSNQYLWDRHPELFHYTSQRGLFGILESQYLRATDWRYLNDKWEIQQFRAPLTDLLLPVYRELYEKRTKTHDALKILRAHGADLSEAHQQDSITMANTMYDSLLSDNPEGPLFDVYVTSFCTPDEDFHEVRHHGLLSQWRCYGKNGGYAIVFDTEALLKLMNREAAIWPSFWSCGPVGYSSDSRDVLHQRIEALPELIEALKNCDFETRDSVEPVLSPFLRCAVHYKHWAFAEEREVRLVLLLNGKKMAQAFADEGRIVKERARCSFPREDGSRVPCLNIFDGLPTEQRFHLPIKRVIVGPGPEQNQRESELTEFLGKKGYDVVVTRSGIPLRF